VTTCDNCGRTAERAFNWRQVAWVEPGSDLRKWHFCSNECIASYYARVVERIGAR
jgi:hypothetical protein